MLARHQQAPAIAERERFLQHCAENGKARATLISVANELRVIAIRLDIGINSPITREHIVIAAERWARHQRRCGRSTQLRWSRERFVQVAVDWLSFLNRLEVKKSARPDCMELSDQFLLHLREERGLSTRTIHAYRWHVEKFLLSLAARDRQFSEVLITDADAFFASLSERNWCRVSLATSVKALRAFLRDAAHRGWCSADIAIGMIGPRLFREEGLPVGPSWSDV